MFVLKGGPWEIDDDQRRSMFILRAASVACSLTVVRGPTGEALQAQVPVLTQCTRAKTAPRDREISWGRLHFRWVFGPTFHRHRADLDTEEPMTDRLEFNAS
jgi:hypothetical protein